MTLLNFGVPAASERAFRPKNDCESRVQPIQNRESRDILDERFGLKMQALGKHVSVLVGFLLAEHK